MKNVTQGKKANLKSLIRLHSANKINNYTGGGGGKNKRKKPKEYTEQVKT